MMVAVILILFEIMLVYCNVYPNNLKTEKSRKNGVIFYILLNIISNWLIFFWLIRDFQM